MPNYWVYRINTRYDGFTPQRIPERTNNQRILYNWAAYLEALERGDIVLTYFLGGCKPGIYLMSRIVAVDLNLRTANVTGKIIASDTTRPLVEGSANRALFEKLWSRPRGAELVVPESLEREIFELVKGYVPYVRLPGSPDFPAFSLADVPRIDLSRDVSDYLARSKVIGTFWIKPSQASWIANAPAWLHYITGSFSKFKGGDLSNVEAFADSLGSHIARRYDPAPEYFHAICSVPLNDSKRQAGEKDRVRELALRVAERTGVPYRSLFRLTGDISRRLYKLNGRSDSEFRKDYLDNLIVTDIGPLAEAVNEGKMLLLVDDVFTDGLTTRTVIEGCRRAFNNDGLEFIVATLGVMTKKRNMVQEICETWEN